MRPYPEEVVAALQRGMVSHFAPELQSSYAQSQFGAGAMLFGVALRDANTAAQDLVDANAALRELLADVGTALKASDAPDAPAAAGVAGRLPEAAPDVRLSSLRAENDALRAIFCELAAIIERAGDDGALVALAPVRGRVYAWFSAEARKRTVPLLNN